MIFYLGTHMINHAQYFNYSFISINRLRRRKSDYPVNNWILDSGAFTEISQYGYFRYPISEYARQINRWSKCGNLEAAVTQDYMCEPFILAKTGQSVIAHQQYTIQRYDELVRLTSTFVMPVLQGYQPDEYVRHIVMYGDRLTHGMRVGVGSVCKRNKDPKAIIAVLKAIKRVRPDLRLHGFGLKLTALADCYINSMLYSADSMAWSYHSRRCGGNANGLSEAVEFYNRINTIKGSKANQLVLI